jgi:cleavage stimulation factor subunit 3
MNGDGDTTQPTAEMQQALDQLSSDTVPNSQESIKEQPKEEEMPQQPTLSEWQTLRNRLRDSPHDSEGWNRLVELAESSGEIDEIKETYEALLETYPNTSSAQIAYLNHFLGPGAFPFAEAIFKRILRSSPSVDLWKFYLTYVRRVNTGPSTREAVRKSYEFAVSHVGQDKDSGDIWMDYIQFLRAGETTTTWEEQQKMDALRKVYHRAVQIPIENIERLWSELEAFESNLNKITAKKFMADLSPSYMQARTVLRQLQRHVAPLFPAPPSPSTASRPAISLPPIPKFNAPEKALVGAWKNYLKWEESNPLELEEKDRPTLIQRIQGVYRKAVIWMRFYGEIWYMSYVWHNSVGKHEDALNILKDGIKANPASFVLNFAYAEELEMKKDKDGVFAIFDKFIEILRADLEALESRLNSANSSFESNGSNNVPANGSTLSALPVTATGLTEAGTQSNNSSFNTQSSDDKPPKSKELSERRTEYGLAWIMYMRAARRVASQQAARTIFTKGRKDRWLPWEVYEAAALMEYHVSKKSDVASRIFDKGFEVFPDEVQLVLRHLSFLISVNDDQNARALFERVIGAFPPESARPLWDRWARYEYQYGDLETAQRLEKRIAEVYPADPPIKRFALRHTYMGTDAIAARDLGFSMARQPGAGATAGSSGPLARTDTQQSLISSSNYQTGGGSTAHKRPASPDYRKREDRGSSDYGSGHKRPRALSPPRDRDRERWDPPRRRFGSPGWDRDRDRDVPPPPPPPRKTERDREEEKGPDLPPVISWFVGQLPAPAAFDGPVFRTDDLMMLFRNAVIPSSTRVRSPPPGPPRGGGRPPPDYGPYQGPGGGRGGRRY